MDFGCWVEVVRSCEVDFTDYEEDGRNCSNLKPKGSPDCGFTCKEFRRVITIRCWWFFWLDILVYLVCFLITDDCCEVVLEDYLSLSFSCCVWMQLKWFSLGHWVPEPLNSRSLFLLSNGSCVTLIVHLGLCNLFSCPVTTNYIFVNVMRVGSWVKYYSSNFTRRGKAGPLRCCWNGCGRRCCGAFGVFFSSKIYHAHIFSTWDCLVSVTR